LNCKTLKILFTLIFIALVSNVHGGIPGPKDVFEYGFDNVVSDERRVLSPLSIILLSIVGVVFLWLKIIVREFVIKRRKI
jgi:hypothetical protein